MSEKRLTYDILFNNYYQIIEKDDDGYHRRLAPTGIIDLLNEQQSKIDDLNHVNEQLRKYNGQLKERLEKINGGYGHLTHRNGLTANEWLIESQERELKKKNEQISDWIERHSKDIAKICEQQVTINQLKEENEQLKKRLEHYKEVEAMNGDGKNE